MSYRFLRSYKLQIGKKGTTQGITIAPPFRIEFDVEKSTESEPNEANIKIYNMSADTRAFIESPDMRCVLYVGYEEEGEPLLLACGDIAFAYSYIDGADWITDLTVLDGLIEIRDTVVSLGYEAGVNSTTILTALAGQMGLTLIAPNSLAERTWSNGFSFYGAARTALSKVVAGTGLEWSVQNGELQIINKGNVTKRQGVVLAADGGLIGFPERTREAAKSKKADNDDKKNAKKRDCTMSHQAQDGWKVKSLILPQVNPGDKVKLESRTVTNWFRVDNIRHNGDSHQGDWMSELDLIEASALTSGQKEAQKEAEKTARKHRKKRKKKGSDDGAE